MARSSGLSAETVHMRIRRTEPLSGWRGSSGRLTCAANPTICTKSAPARTTELRCRAKNPSVELPYSGGMKPLGPARGRTRCGEKFDCVIGGTKRRLLDRDLAQQFEIAQ